MGEGRCVFFFFKQKTAYELRKGDWSSDVCSSDLGRLRGTPAGRRLVRPVRPVPPAVPGEVYRRRRTPPRDDGGRASSRDEEPDHLGRDPRCPRGGRGSRSGSSAAGVYREDPPSPRRGRTVSLRPPVQGEPVDRPVEGMVERTHVRNRGRPRGAGEHPVGRSRERAARPWVRPRHRESPGEAGPRDRGRTPSGPEESTGIGGGARPDDGRGRVPQQAAHRESRIAKLPRPDETPGNGDVPNRIPNRGDGSLRSPGETRLPGERVGRWRRPLDRPARRWPEASWCTIPSTRRP